MSVLICDSTWEMALLTLWLQNLAFAEIRHSLLPANENAPNPVSLSFTISSGLFSSRFSGELTISKNSCSVSFLEMLGGAKSNKNDVGV
jgi:hypothetical protein